MSPNAEEGGVAGYQPMGTAEHRSPNVGDLTPYLIYDYLSSWRPLLLMRRFLLNSKKTVGNSITG
jgi:hypothetical protein